MADDDDGVNSRPRKAFVQIAPMLAVTDRPFRQFIRGLTHHAELWTEMCVDSTILHTQDLRYHLDYESNEHPIVCQLGGCDPSNMAKAAELVQQWGYDEVNINVGCPSTKVSTKGCFGCSLMKSPEIVRDVVHSIKRQCPGLAVSVKTRVGVDEWDSQQFLNQFVETVSTAGCDRFIVHARKAWLKGLNPTLNRTLPPLQYERVFQLVKDFPQLSISLNGGVASLDEAEDLMYGRWRPQSIETPRKNRIKTKKERNSDDDPIEEQIEQMTEERTAETMSSDDDCADDDDDDEEEEESRDEKGMNSSEWDLDCLPMDLDGEIGLNSNNRRTRRYSQQPMITTRVVAPIPKSEIKTTVDDVYELMNELEMKMKVNEGRRRTSKTTLLDGIMIGRAAMNNPCILASVDSRFYGVSDPITAHTPRSIVNNYIDFLDHRYSEIDASKSCFQVMKPVLGILTGRPGSKQFRYKIDEVTRLESDRLSYGDIIRNVVEFIDEHFPGSFDLPTQARSINSIN